MTELLVMFTRYPEPGVTKTRLIPVLGAAGAAKLQRDMTEHLFAQMALLRKSRAVDLEICFEGGSEALLQSWLGPGPSFFPQGPGDLGERMDTAFKRGFASGYTRIILIGSDCPELSPSVIGEAFESLRAADVVFGPATDGGYYLVGLRKAFPELFRHPRWGGSEVLADSIRILERLGSAPILLAPLDDVDRPEDLAVWERVSGCCYARDFDRHPGPQ